ncbi:hypothetical protein CSO01_30900 [Cellulomonas soli]|uniref:Uncharacterized protein n=1 Tax=Cellulomonas soli TaxID=931535 RepID=A0A512PGP6_9CELL|nr:hypothetical protein CSO01_30900 [Cellulomonas soli]
MTGANGTHGHALPLLIAYEVSCRVRVGEHPVVRPAEAVVRLHPKDTVNFPVPAIGSPAPAGGSCGPRTAAGFGVPLEGFSEEGSWKQDERTGPPARLSRSGHGQVGTPRDDSLRVADDTP